jgi:serine protease
VVTRAHERGREVRPRFLRTSASRPRIAAAAGTFGAALLALGAPAAGALPSAAVAPAPLTGRVLVTLRPSGRNAAPRASLAATGARAGGPSAAQIGLVTVRPPAGVPMAAFLAHLRHDPAVRSAELEHRFSYRFAPNDPAFTTAETAEGTPPGTPVEWWAQREDLPAAWDATKGDGVKIAIIDSGIDATHPEFAGKIVATNEVDALGDGPATVDQVGHGTHVAGLACADGNNGIGLAGAGLDCGLIVEKSDLTEGSVAAEIVDATNRGAQVINMSFGTQGTVPAPVALDDAVSYAVRHGVVLVAAASDASQPGQVPVQEQGDPCNVLQPAGSGANLTAGSGLCVTSAGYAGARSSFSGSGSEISLAAFGSFADNAGPPGIFSTFPSNTTQIESGSLVPYVPGCTSCRTTFMGDNRYAYLEGTSMASPMVAGIAGLVKSVNPYLGAGDVITVLKQSAQRPAGTGWTSDLGWGIVDAGAAVALARTIDRVPPVATITAPKRTRASRITLHFSGSDPAPDGLPASGVDHYLLHRTIDRHTATQIASTRATTLTVRVRAGHLYGWYVLAVDKAGNREPSPANIAYTRVLGKQTSGTRRKHG